MSQIAIRGVVSPLNVLRGEARANAAYAAATGIKGKWNRLPAKNKRCMQIQIPPRRRLAHQATSLFEATNPRIPPNTIRK